MKEKLRYLVYFGIIISIELFCSFTLNSMGIRKENILMVFIVGVLLIATFTKGYFYGLLASIISVLCFNFLYIDPNYDFHISDPNDFMLILFFLMTSVIACSLTDRFQKQIIISKKNESISKQLYSLSERLLNVSGIEYILLKGNQYIEESIQIKTNISLEIKEESKNVIPIIGMNRVLGSIEILSHQGLNEDQMIIIKAAANQLGNALERELTYLEQEKIKVAMEREHMLNSMLRSISHDLRTPLTGIVGASQLMMNQDYLTNEDVYSLAKDIHDQAHWLTQIVENILNMSKIESGNLVLHKNLEVVDDLIYEAIQHLPELEKRNVVVDVPQDLLFINVDGKLMVQVFINILNNAIKYTKEKDQITIQDLLYGLMLRSGNDCALMLAKSVGGSVERFVEMMNEKARDIGMKQTHFSNPSGLDEEDEGNLSTVKEMAILYRYCCQNPLFNQIVKTKEYKRLDGKGYWHNKNRLLKEYPYCVGGKTGYTKKAKRTLITRAIKKQVDLIIVTFNCGNDFEFHQKKYEECFKNYEKLVLFDKGVRNIKGNWYLFENDLLMSKEKDESVSYLIHNEEMFIYRNQTYIKKIKLKKYRFRNFYLMILKDLVYE